MTFKPTTFAKRVVLCAEIALLILGLCVPVIGLLWLVPFHPIQFLWGVLFAVVLIGGSAVIAATLMYLSSNPPRFMNATLLEWRRERDEKWVRHHVLLCTCGHLWGRHLSGQTNNGHAKYGTCYGYRDHDVCACWRYTPVAMEEWTKHLAKKESQ